MIAYFIAFVKLANVHWYKTKLNKILLQLVLHYLLHQILTCFSTALCCIVHLSFCQCTSCFNLFIQCLPAYWQTLIPIWWDTIMPFLGSWSCGWTMGTVKTTSLRGCLHVCRWVIRFFQNIWSWFTYKWIVFFLLWLGIIVVP